MDLDELRTVQAKERRKDSLQHLRDSFYTDVATYIADLRAQRDRRAERVDDPFSDDGVRRLSDEIETAEEVAEATYERRVGKVVKLASFAAADMAVEEEGMTEDERRLFEDLVDRIERNKATVLDALSGVTGPGDLGNADTEPAANAASGTAKESEKPDVDGNDRSDLLAEAMGAEDPAGTDEAPTDVSQPPGHTGTNDSETRPEVDPDTDAETDGPDTLDDEPSALRTDGATAASELADDPHGGSDPGLATGTDRTTVRITDDVGSILGVDDREYDLEREDVVTLPETNAGPLLEQGAAERVD
ncbi:DNA replication factor GINS [Halalkaliarchaeum desulfuricum]|uniref:DNA replication factor GINS n=1 Tax=Halalkaliarchaeum desulfuricum TaxID=2055893 RepID=A0A343THK8_9EURY|nr:hypothetical protein [Halalkaliarchaeum desulfuricum]AUX08580.1 DNA replication factor GINS [Halalkaliarchaeum desulfuricum]